jgi:hypothetical protein
MRNPLVLPALFCSLLPLALAAQGNAPAAVEVHGLVVDAVNGGPVAGAVVELRGTGRRALSDSAGSFVLHPVAPGTYQWAISRMGYADWEESSEVADGDEFTIALLARPGLLEGITAVASQMEHRRLASGVAVQTLERTPLRLSAAPTAFEVVHDLGVMGVPCRQSMTGEPNCAWVRGELVPVLVYVDEQRASGGLSDLLIYRPQDLFTIESYAGGRMIRVLTVPFAERVARGRAALMPLAF